MRKFMATLQFFLMEHLKSKGTLISTAVITILLFVIIGGGQFFGGDKSKIGYVCGAEACNIDIAEMNKQSEGYELIELPAKTDVKKKVEDGDFDGILSFSEKPEPTLEYTHKSEDVPSLVSLITYAIEQNYTGQAIEKHDIASDAVEDLFVKVAVKDRHLGEESSFMLVYAFVFIIYILITAFGQMIASSIASEKDSRVMEILLSKVNPLYMMYAKILSILIVALLQFLIIAAALYATYLLGWLGEDGMGIFGADIGLADIPVRILAGFLVYFVLGFLLYATIFAALGSIVSRIEDIGTLALPVAMLLMAGFFSSIKTLMDPHSLITTITSYIPFTSPFVMFTRLSMGEAGTFENVIGAAILLLSLVLLNMLASRIYVNGVMTYSGKVNFKTVLGMTRKH